MKTLAESVPALAGWGGRLEPVAWKSLVILALVFVLMTWWRRGTAAARHLAWTMTFLCLLCLPVFVYCLPTWPTPAWMLPSVLNNALPDSLSFDLHSNINRKSQAAAAAGNSGQCTRFDNCHPTSTASENGHQRKRYRLGDLVGGIYVRSCTPTDHSDSTGTNGRTNAPVRRPEVPEYNGSSEIGISHPQADKTAGFRNFHIAGNMGICAANCGAADGSL